MLNLIVKQYKYLAVKPKGGHQFIRVKSLGEHYSEQALRNRIVHKERFEIDINKKVNSAKNSDSLELIIHKTIKHYTMVFAADVLPVRKKNPQKPFIWENDAELDKLAELNKLINAGVTITKAKNDFKRLEERISKNETLLEMSNYNTDTEKEIADIKQALTMDRKNLKKVSWVLDALEKIVGGTYVQSLIDEEKQRRQANYIPNGYKHADGTAKLTPSAVRRR